MFSYKCNVKKCPPCSVLTFVVHVGFILLIFFAGFCVAVIAPRIKWKKWRRVIMIFQRLQWLVILSYSKTKLMQFIWLVLLNFRSFFSLSCNLFSGSFVLVSWFLSLIKNPFLGFLILFIGIKRFFCHGDVMMIYVFLLIIDKDGLLIIFCC